MRAIKVTAGGVLVLGLAAVVVCHLAAGDWLRACGVVGGAVALLR